jgi:hypothetical protein
MRSKKVGFLICMPPLIDLSLESLHRVAERIDFGTKIGRMNFDGMNLGSGY